MHEMRQGLVEERITHPSFGEVSYNDLSSLLLKASWDLSPSQSSVFYCNAQFTQQFWGTRQGQAFEGHTYAQSAATITNTEGGKLLDKMCAKIQFPNGTTQFELGDSWAHQLTILSSSLFAQAAKGDVLAFIHEATHRPPITLVCTFKIWIDTGNPVNGQGNM